MIKFCNHWAQAAPISAWQFFWLWAWEVESGLHLEEIGPGLGLRETTDAQTVGTARAFWTALPCRRAKDDPYLRVVEDVLHGPFVRTNAFQPATNVNPHLIQAWHDSLPNPTIRFLIPWRISLPEVARLATFVDTTADKRREHMEVMVHQCLIRVKR